MKRTVRASCILAAFLAVAACGEVVPPEGGAAGDPMPMPVEMEESPELEEAPPLDELMALEPEGLGVELPDDLLVDKKIVGADNRKPVAKTTVKPYSTIATLIVSFPKAAAPGMCTGSMITTDAVLTAAHCVYNASKGGWASSMRVIPAAYPDAAGKTVRPYGSASALRAFTPLEYRNASDFWGREPHDYAVVRLGKGITGLPSTRAYAAMAAPTVFTPITLAGYHGDKCAGSAKCQAAASSYVMHVSTDSIREVLEADPAPRVFNHYADSKPGASGSPLVASGAFANTIFAVHVAGLRSKEGATWNMGVLLTPTAVANIKAWAERTL